jgi:hypothetical protein
VEIVNGSLLRKVSVYAFSPVQLFIVPPFILKNILIWMLDLAIILFVKGAALYKDGFVSWGCFSVEEYLSSMGKALGLIPRTTK